MPPTRTRQIVFLGLPLVLVAGLVGIAVWLAFFRTEPSTTTSPPDELRPDPLPADPRIAFQTRFRNVAPEVKYVGDAACISCHEDIAKTYHAHPMGRSAFAGNVNAGERYEAKANNPFTSAGYELKVQKQGDRFVHILTARDAAGAPLPTYNAPADIAVGSATRGRSYLTIQNGAVWQSPVSWYTAAGKWDLSPGFDLADGGRRPITAECLFCHLDRVEPIAGTLNQYRQPLAAQLHIGCERCHGPGELHVNDRLAGKDPGIPDHSIVNPKHLAADLRADVCRQCHLQGQERVTRRGRNPFEYRPGLPLEQFVTIFVRHPDLAELHRSVGQIEQMEKSKCFTATKGALGCTSCHDPHVKPATAADADRFFRMKCLSCHDTKGCSLPPTERAVKDDSCFRCHMPRAESANIAHTAVTDHSIPRVPAKEPPRSRKPAPGTHPLVPYPPGPHAPPAAERERDLGIAFARLAMSAGHPALGDYVGVMAADRLTASLKTWPGDLEAWLALASARAARGEFPEALDAARKACELAPDSERPLARLADIAVSAGEFELAAQTADRLVKISPTTVEHHLTAATSRLELKGWASAENAAKKALAIQPLHPQAHMYLAVARHHQGDAAGGRREAETAAGLLTSPAARAVYLDWYRERTKFRE